MKHCKLLLFFMAIMLVAGCPKPTEPEPPAPTIPTELFSTSYSGTKGNLWTIMIYMDGDNDLEAAAIEDFCEIEAGLLAAKNLDSAIESKLNIIVLFDRIPGEDSSNGNWTNTRLYKATPDTNPDVIDSELLFNSPEQNMGDPNLLKNFVSWTKSNFPADNYALVLWNHGGGTRSRSITPTVSTARNKGVKAVCWDDTNNGDTLYLDEVQQALSANFSSGSKLSLLGFDACLMGMVEVAYEFRNLANYMVASMHTEQGDGWDYEYIIKQFSQGSISNYAGTSTFSFAAGNPAPTDFAKMLVYAYEHYIENPANGSNNSGETLSAIDLDSTKMEALKTALFSLANKMEMDAETGKKTSIELDRDDAVNYFSNTLATNNVDGDEIAYPFFDIYDFCYIIANDKNSRSYSDGLKNAAAAVITKLHDILVWAYGDQGGYRGPFGDGTGYYFGANKSGLSIFFSRGNVTYENYSHYAYQWWYRATRITNPGDYGNIDFAESNTGGSVDTWRELMNKWYYSAWGY